MRNTELSSILVPLQQRPLLLPVNCVADVIDYTRPDSRNKQRDNQSANWHLGEIKWRNTSVPLVSFELLNKGRFAEFSATNRIVIMNRTTHYSKHPFYAIVIQGLPKPMLLNRGDVNTSTEKAGPLEKMRVMLREIPASIPNLELLEKQLVTITG